MPKLKIKKGDNVVVIAGRDKGKTGEVLRVFPTERASSCRASTWSSGTPSRGMGEPGGIVEKELAIAHLQCRACRSRDRASRRASAIKFLDDGRKVRFARRSGEVIDSVRR